MRVVTGLSLFAFCAAAVSTAVAAPPQWNRHVVAQGYRTSTAVAADFTGDGIPDIMTSGNGKTFLYVAPRWTETIVYAPDPPLNCIHSAVLDVDRDGRLDWIGASYSNPGRIVWLRCPEQPTQQRWQAAVVDAKVDGIHGLEVGDIDGDGRPDLAANSAQPRGPFAESLVWYRTPAQEALREPWPRYVLADHDAPGLSHYIGLGDVNGDGRTDAASAAKGGPQAEPGTGDWFAWWEAPKNPTRVWTKHLIADDQPGATNILMADLNSDGQTDFVASRGHGRGVLWFEAPDWKPHDINTELAGPHCLALGDIDGDGDVDAVTCAKDDEIAAWFENQGEGKFQTRIIGRDQAAYEIRLVDMNSDGRLDVLIAGSTSQNLVWYEQRLGS